MPQTSPWPRRRQALWWGVPLGLLEIGVVALLQLLDGWLCLVLGALLYFLVPALAGFCAARWPGAAAQDAAHLGWRLWGVSVLVVGLVGISYLIMGVARSSHPPPAPSPGLLAAFFLAGLFLLVLLLNGLGGLIAYAGGLVGARLGQHYEPAPGQDASATDMPPSLQ